MFKAIEFPNKEFATKDDMYRHLVANKAELISLKRSKVHKSCEKGQLTVLNADKALKAISSKSFEVKDNCIYPIISTTNYLDSHQDVHFDGSMTKTAKEQQGKVHYALDHKLDYHNVLAWPKHVKMFIANVDWSLVGKGYTGTTEALVFEIEKDNIRNKSVLKDIEDNVVDFENSISMIYHKINLGINSENPEFKEAKEYHDKHASKIVNQEDLNEDGYFWGVEELGIWKEGSLVVAGGSNSATSIYSKDIEAVADTSKTEPSNDTQSTFTELLKQIKTN